MAELQSLVNRLRRHAADDPDTYTVELAGALVNLGSALMHAREPADGGAALLEAHNLFRAVVRAGPAADWRARAGLAMAAYNVAHFMIMNGQVDQAEPLAEESFLVRRELAEADPDRHLEGYALSLGIYAITQIELGRPGNAMPKFLESTEIMRGLTEADPGTHLPAMVATLQWLGEGLREFPAPTSAELQQLIDDLQRLRDRLGESHRELRLNYFDAAFLVVVTNAGPGELRARMPPPP
ncbi:hypothetical protein [Actinocrispum wychmicini]|uniref:hypothetical protein n=1 Tax=Actinocrispum wychmicini TaxID=1213861 RepID=UPI00104455B1|nr:hypothetical protein [Actinocrispum wychmicini]